MMRSGAGARKRIFGAASGNDPSTPGRLRLQMAVNEILEEATNLHTVSKRLHRLAAENAPVSEALTSMATAVRQSATLLEVLVAIKMGPGGDVEKASN
jgi:hypothetical protein